MSALAYLDAKNIVHRDIKLDNIVVLDNEEGEDCQDRSIKIIDFGTATKVLKKRSSLAGTKYYMSPEALKGVLDPRTDVWAAGVILYIFLMGKFPFKG